MRSTSVRAHRWSRDDYHRMVDEGILPAGLRVELIDGEILDMAAHDKPHADAIRRGNQTLSQAFGDRFLVSVQLPLDLGMWNEPEPDFALIPRDALGQYERHPTTADLVIEVASTSLEHDRARKARIYAQAGLPEYWIVNLRDRQLEVHRDPTPEGYRTTALHSVQEACAPLVAPEVAIRVADLLD